LHIESPKWTFVFIAAAVITFVFQQITDLWIYLAFFPAFAFQNPWMFVTSIFLHANFEHLLFNMIALFFFGITLERAIGHRAFVALFLGSGVVGNIGYLITASDPFTPAIGASGAVYGVLGALAVLAPLMMIFVYGLIPVPMIVAAAFWVLLDFVGLSSTTGIAHGAHIGGMVVGVSFGLYVRWRTMSARHRVYY
jgi:membrane associated rhomboid family serine protease